MSYPRDVVVLRRFLPVDTCDRVLKLAEDRGMYPQRGKTTGQGAARECDVKWLFLGAPERWLFELVLKAFWMANKRFEFDVHTGSRWTEDNGLQVTRYRHGDLYDWHMDKGRYARSPISDRKLSLTVQLSDPQTYQGGGLQLNLGSETWDAPRDRGTAIIFPSYVIHRVTPIIRGHRDALVTWLTGPEFR